MTESEQTIAALREAVAVSPDNGALRNHLADVLQRAGRDAEAAEVLRALLGYDAGNGAARLSLAQLLYRQGDVAYGPLAASFQDEPNCPPAAMLLFARWKASTGGLDIARSAYAAAVNADAALADEAFARVLAVPENEDVDDAPPSEAGVLEKPAITFADVGGMAPVKEAIRQKIIYPLQKPELYRAYGRGIGGGILMYGPPGVGKTFFARATAGETKSHFVSIGITDVLDMYLGESERQLHALFTLARRNTPCVLFFDEVDALAAKRVDLRGSAGRTLVNQFLAELDSVKTSNEGVLVLAATNAPWNLDSAFRRPGRFDRIIFVPPPDAEARTEIVRLLCHGKPIETIDYRVIAKRTDGYTGADLRALVDAAIERKLNDAVRDGVPLPLRTNDLMEAAATVKPSTAEWFASARNYALYANEGGAYDDIIAYLKL